MLTLQRFSKKKKKRVIDKSLLAAVINKYTLPCLALTSTCVRESVFIALERVCECMSELMVRVCLH